MLAYPRINIWTLTAKLGVAHKRVGTHLAQIDSGENTKIGTLLFDRISSLHSLTLAAIFIFLIMFSVL